MIKPISVLSTSSAMARHAAIAHGVAGENIARADIPGATASRAENFMQALREVIRGDEPRRFDTGQPIALDKEMAQLSRTAGRHQTATTIWSTSLQMIRSAGASPR